MIFTILERGEIFSLLSHHPTATEFDLKIINFYIKILHLNNSIFSSIYTGNLFLKSVIIHGETKKYYQTTFCRGLPGHI
jgi:hypothetical protein